MQKAVIISVRVFATTVVVRAGFHDIGISLTGLEQVCVMVWILLVTLNRNTHRVQPSFYLFLRNKRKCVISLLNEAFTLLASYLGLTLMTISTDGPLSVSDT